MFLEVWGSELRRLREASGQTQIDLALKLQTTQKQVSRVENGGNVTLGTMYRWFKVCGVRPYIPDNTRE